ncbi:DUF2752 domain-containing protein [Flavobacterium turcicum]|uniref:DUF2752 domain-containing protein n=1 Tax=Flavobacterium turcicum TaxID=2764718 RepID=A0ABR7JDV4_9FLAO|nr:DUF2752 domain-containing protein [Flavobacterium turcicum]MBC5862642.1 DUF2752 domain-containing protein [Flavobacterium turcicum]NHL01374.1 DUF2752 domain-containing protein [Flavobacterium turcicum]
MRKAYFYLSNLVLILAPIVLLFLPKTWFDKGESTCLSVVLAGIECYACGLTRAVMHFIHFDFVKAWEYNPLCFVVVPMLFVMWLKAIYDIQGKKMPGIIGRLTYPKEA